MLAEHPGRVARSVQQVTQLALDERALVLDHDQLVDADRERADIVCVQRPDEAELDQPDPELLELGVADPQLGQRAAQRCERRTRCDQRGPRAVGLVHDPVEAMPATVTHAGHDVWTASQA